MEFILCLWYDGVHTVSVAQWGSHCLWYDGVHKICVVKLLANNYVLHSD